MIVARKQLLEVFRERKRDDPDGPDKPREEKKLQQQDASMGELIHALDSSAAPSGHKRKAGNRCYPEPAWVLFAWLIS